MVKQAAKPTRIEGVITWIGSMSSLALHTAIFIGFFLLSIFGVIEWNTMLLVLTTAVSLEAIYLAIFIQLTVNRNTESLREVEEDIDEIQEDVEELGEDVEEMQEDIEEMSEDVEEMQEDLEEMNEEEIEEEKREQEQARNLDQLTDDIRRVLAEVEALKKKK